MTQGADNTGLDPNSQPTAGGETSVPKYRLDEVSARLRAAEDALRVKDDLINQYARPQQNQQVNFEEIGLDDRTGKAVMMLAEQIANKKISEASKGFQQQLAHLGQKTDRAEFLQSFPGKEQYIDKINAYRLRQYQETGTGMSMETAYKLVVFDEMNARTRPAPAPQAAAAPNPQGVQAPQAFAPPAPQAAPQAAAPQAGEEMSYEDMERALDQQMQASHVRI